MFVCIHTTSIQITYVYLYVYILQVYRVAQCSAPCAFLADISCHYVSLCRSLIFLPPASFLFPSATGESTWDPGVFIIIIIIFPFWWLSYNKHSISLSVLTTNIHGATQLAGDGGWACAGQQNQAAFACTSRISKAIVAVQERMGVCKPIAGLKTSCAFVKGRRRVGPKAAVRVQCRAEIAAAISGSAHSHACSILMRLSNAQLCECFLCAQTR